MNAQAEEWFVSDGQEVFGPMARAFVREAMSRRSVAWVRHAEWASWRSVHEVPDFSDDVSSGVRRTGDSVVAARELALIIAAPSLRDAAMHVLRATLSHLACAAGLLHLSDGKRFAAFTLDGPSRQSVKASDAVVKELRAQRAVIGHRRTESRLAAVCDPGAPTIALPLRARGALVGVLELGADDRRGPFDSRDIAFVEQLAAGLALAPR